MGKSTPCTRIETPCILFASSLDPAIPGVDLHTPKMSDSASLDEWLEHLILEKNWSLLCALLTVACLGR
jgi:hypothetical protein